MVVVVACLIQILNCPSNQPANSKVPDGFINWKIPKFSLKVFRVVFFFVFVFPVFLFKVIFLRLGRGPNFAIRYLTHKTLTTFLALLLYMREASRTEARRTSS